MTREEFEIALDKGRIETKITNGSWWKTRRNGKTQRWKTRPNEFRIPIKYGFKSYGQVTDTDDLTDGKFFRVKP